MESPARWLSRLPSPLPYRDGVCVEKNVMGTAKLSSLDPSLVKFIVLVIGK